MDLVHVRCHLAAVTVVIAGVLGTSATARAQQPAAAPAAAAAVTDTASLLDHAAIQARLVAARLDSAAAAQAGRRAPSDPSATQYQNGLMQIQQGQCDAAYLLFRAAVAANGNSARNHGDLAYSLACRQRWDDAATEYATAVRLQSANAWYYIGLATVRIQEQRWTEAAANFSLAVATDSSVIAPDVVEAAATTYEHSGNSDELLAWARAGTQRLPNDPGPWLRVAMMLRRGGDTTHDGLNAIRRFHALSPDSRLGFAILSLYLSDMGQTDSALAFALLASADTALKEYASLVYLRVGARLLQTRSYERAAQVLFDGRNMASPGNHSRYSLYLAHANIQRAVPLFQDAVQKKNCDEGQKVDSILVSVDHDLHESLALDSVQSTHILTDILPGFKSKVEEFRGTCR